MQHIEVIQNKNENIEILRAVAILLVLFVHIGWLLVFPSTTYTRLKSFFDGNVGVDLFFVISGYVITRSFSKSFYDSQSKKGALIAFWVKRAYRLLPAAFFWLFVVFIYQCSQGFYGDFHNILFRQFIAMGSAIGNVYNLWQAYCSANPSDTFWCNIYCFYGHYWSLSLEQQFYIVLPLLFFFFRKKALIWIAVVLIALLFFWERPYWSYGWFFRIDGFCWGILIALLPYFSKRIERVDRLFNNSTIAPFFLYPLIFLLPFFSKRLQGFGTDAVDCGIGILSLACAIAVLLAVRYENSFGTLRPYRKLMIWIGSRSYSIYIIHLIVFEFLKQAWLKYYAHIEFTAAEKRLTNLGIVILAFIIIFIFSEFNYRMIEVPMRLRGKELAGRLFWRTKKAVAQTA